MMTTPNSPWEVKHEDRLVLIEHLISKLERGIPRGTVSGIDTRAAFDKSKTDFFDILERIRHHVEMLEPWNVR